MAAYLECGPAPNLHDRTCNENSYIVGPQRHLCGRHFTVQTAFLCKGNMSLEKYHLKITIIIIVNKDYYMKEKSIKRELINLLHKKDNFK